MVRSRYRTINTCRSRGGNVRRINHGYARHPLHLTAHRLVRGRYSGRGCPSLLNTGVSVVPNTPTDSPREVSSARQTNNCHVPLSSSATKFGSLLPSRRGKTRINQWRCQAPSLTRAPLPPPPPFAARPGECGVARRAAARSCSSPRCSRACPHAQPPLPASADHGVGLERCCQRRAHTSVAQRRCSSSRRYGGKIR